VVADVASADARTVLSQYGFWFGYIGTAYVRLFTGNYINYQYCDTCDQSQSKISIAKRVITTLVQTNTMANFGVMTFKNNSSAGTGDGNLIAPIGTAVATIVSAVNAITAGGYTPLGEQIQDAGSYFKGTFETFSSPIADT